MYKMALPDKNYSNKEFKFNGGLILKLYGGKCSVCWKVKDWMEIHHIDKMNDNNEPTNLIPVCKDCHMIVHSKRFAVKLCVDERVIEAYKKIMSILESNIIDDK